MKFFDRKRKQLEKLSLAYETHRSRMFAAAYTILRNEADAEEAIIKTFERLLKYPQYIDNPLSEQTGRLLVILAKHQAIDRYRRNRKFPQISYEEVENICKDESEFEQLETAELLNLALEKLPQIYKEVLLLKFSHGYENDEIAKMLDISEAAVRKRISRAREKLRPICEEYGLIEKEEKADE